MGNALDAIRRNRGYRDFGGTAWVASHDPALPPDAQKALGHARLIALATRLQSEHPVLARFAAHIHRRVDEGGQPVRLRDDEWTTLLHLFGEQLSDTERDLLLELRREGVFSSAMLRDQVDPFRRSQLEQKDRTSLRAWLVRGSGNVAVAGLKMGVNWGLKLVSGGLAMIGSVLGSAVGSRAEQSIKDGFDRRVGGFGVNRFEAKAWEKSSEAEGTEVDDEDRFVLARIAGQESPADKASALRMLADHRALIGNLSEVRGQVPVGPEDALVRAAVDGYAKGCERLLTSKTPVDLVQETRALRRNLLDGSVIRAAAGTAIRTEFGPAIDPQARELYVALDSFAHKVAKARESAEKNELPVELALGLERDAAGLARRLASTSAARDLDPRLGDLLLQLASHPADEALKTREAKKLAKNVDDISANLQVSIERHSRKEISLDEAGEIAAQAEARFVAVAARYCGRPIEVGPEPTVEVKSREAGGYSVVRSRGQDRTFRVELGADGSIERTSFQHPELGASP